MPLALWGVNVVNRVDIAYILLCLMAGTAIAVACLTYRYSRYARALRHGQRRAKPVWKPFWMN